MPGKYHHDFEFSMLQFEVLRYVKEISPRPIFFVYGDPDHSRSFSEVAYEKAAEPREKYIVEGCGHIDLYDRVDKTPFEKIAEFMRENL